MGGMTPHHRVHRASILVLAVSVFFVAGCSARPVPEMLLEGDRPSMLDDDAEAERRRGRPIHASLWFSAKELDSIARRYARERRIDFKFSGVEIQIWVPRSRDYLARVQYSSGIGHPVLWVIIAWDGSVREHGKGTAIDTIESAPDAGRPPTAE